MLRACYIEVDVSVNCVKNRNANVEIGVESPVIVYKETLLDTCSCLFFRSIFLYRSFCKVKRISERFKEQVHVIPLFQACRDTMNNIV